jgi:hypothetical protein
VRTATTAIRPPSSSRMRRTRAPVTDQARERLGASPQAGSRGGCRTTAPTRPPSTRCRRKLGLEVAGGAPTGMVSCPTTGTMFQLSGGLSARFIWATEQHHSGVAIRIHRESCTGRDRSTRAWRSRLPYARISRSATCWN